MKLTRRQIITTSLSLGVSALAWKYFNGSIETTGFAPKGLILGGGQGLHQGQQIYFLSAVNLNSAKPDISHIPLDFLGHGLSFNPLNSNLVSIFEKKGPGACELNLMTGETRKIETDKSRFFYGHGVYVLDQKSNLGFQNKIEPKSTAPTKSFSNLKLLSTETVLSTGEGLIVIRDAMTLKIEGQFPSYGANPHDCKLIENGSVLAITNGGAPIGQNPKPSVTYVDVYTQKLLEKFEIEDQRLNAGHLAISNNMDLVVVSAPRLGLPETDNGSISLMLNNNVKGLSNTKSNIQLSAQKKLITLTEPKAIIDRLKSETLSLCIDERRGIIVATSPTGNLVTFWNLKTGQFISSLEMPKPRGIIQSKDKAYFLISYDLDASLVFVDADTLKLDESLKVSRAGFSGSHLYSI